MAAEPYSGPERRWLPNYLRVGPLAIPDVTRAQALATIGRSFEDRSQIRVAFCNANTMFQALRSPDYARSLGRFLVLNDGVGVDLCSWLFRGHGFAHNLNGTDLVPALLARETTGRRLYLLGARPGVAERAGDALARRFPQHRIVGARDGYFAPQETDAVVAAINAAAPDLLLVALGNPHQERFIATHAERLDARVLIGVGALLDFTAGTAIRAPRVMQTLRLEWLFRLAQEPGRLGRRYTVEAAAFLALITRLRLAATASRGPAESTAGPMPRLRPGR